jgi:hypothetical protein
LDKNLIFSPVDCGEIRLFVGRRLLNGRRINQFAQRPNVIGRIERHDRRYSGFHESAQILVSESKAQRCPMVGNERRRQLGDQMRLTLPILLLTSILIAGCARQSFNCTSGAWCNGCVPGTNEYEQMVQRQQEEKTHDAMDDALCRSYGAQPGSAAYIECRRKRAGDRRMFERPRIVQPVEGNPDQDSFVM